MARLWGVWTILRRRDCGNAYCWEKLGQVWPVSFHTTTEHAREVPLMALTDNGPGANFSPAVAVKCGQILAARWTLIALGPGSKVKVQRKRGVPSLGALLPLC